MFLFLFCNLNDYFFNGSLIFIVFCVFSYSVPFCVFLLIFDKKNYLKYSLKYIYMSIFFNLFIPFFILLFSSSNIGDVFLSFIPPAILGLVVFSLLSTSLYSFVFLLFQPLFSVLFSLLNNINLYKERKYSKFIFIFIFVFYLIAPDLYFLGAIKKDVFDKKEDCFIVEKRDTPLFHTLINLINKKRHPFVDQLPPSDCK